MKNVVIELSLYTANTAFSYDTFWDAKRIFIAYTNGALTAIVIIPIIIISVATKPPTSPSDILCIGLVFSMYCIFLYLLGKCVYIIAIKDKNPKYKADTAPMDLTTPSRSQIAIVMNIAAHTNIKLDMNLKPKFSLGSLGYTLPCFL